MIDSSIRAALHALADELGSSLEHASPVAWGDTRSTHRLALADGGVFAARSIAGPDASARADELVRRFDRLASAGIAIAGPVELRTIGGRETWLVTPWIDGIVGAAALSDPPAAARLADAMGRLSTRIAGVDPAGLDIDRHWAGPEALGAAGAEWLSVLDTGLGDEARRAAARSLDEVAAAWDRGALWRIGMSHGDFAPINVIVDPRDTVVLLDLDHLQLGPRSLDLAWWGWVVRFHHPEAWATLWPVLLAGAGLAGEPSLDAAAAAVARVRLVERAATAPDEAARAMWLRRLEQTAEW